MSDLSDKECPQCKKKGGLRIVSPYRVKCEFCKARIEIDSISVDKNE